MTAVTGVTGIYSFDHSCGQRSIRYRFGSFLRIKKLLGRTETRTRDRMYLGRIRSVRYISRDDRARIATCSLRTPTDRLMENYSIDVHYTSMQYNVVTSSFIFLHNPFIRIEKTKGPRHSYVYFTYTQLEFNARTSISI